MKFAAFGRTEMLYNSINNCVEKGHEVTLIGTCPAAPEYSRTEKDFEVLAKKYGCPYFCDSSINQPRYLEMIKKSWAKVAISVNWLNIIGQEVINFFNHGIINAHGGDLPRYRGNACQAWAILNGEKQIAMTLHQMTVKLDEGPVLLKKYYELNNRTYIKELYDQFEHDVPKLFAAALDGLEKGTLVPQPQPTEQEKALRCYPRQPSDGYIDWASMSAEYIGRLIRVSSEPYSGAYTYYKGEKLIIWRAYLDKYQVPSLAVSGQVLWKNKENGEVGIAALDGVVVLQEVQVEGELKRVTPLKVVKSLRDRLGKQEI